MKVFNKKIVLAIIGTALVFSGCSSTDKSDINKNNNLASLEVEASKSSKVLLSKGVKENSDEDQSNYSSDLERTFEEVLGKDIEKLNEAQIAELRDIYKEMEDFQITDRESEDEYYELTDQFYIKMMEFGLDVPFASFTEVADKYRDNFTDEEYRKIQDLDEEFYEISNQEMGDSQMNDEEDPYEIIRDKIVKIFDENGLPGEEVFSQIENRNVQYALFDVKDGNITYSDENMDDFSKLTRSEVKVYADIWKHIVKIVPKEYMNLLVKFEINTDGTDNVMAHVVQENEDFSKWRLAIDLKDAIKADGSFSDEFTNTVVHEFAHVMTLHKGQLQGDNIVDEKAYSTNEGYLTTNSYLNKFYQSFWRDIAKEYEAAQEKAQNQQDSDEDPMYAFYEKYEDQFVSDYAATNPAEDIAETYRVFVIEDKPTGNTIRDKKVLFMYEYPELVKIRTDIRSALGLN
jgi:hypothetical protein